MSDVPAIKFITTKLKPISEVTAMDIPPGLSAEDVGYYPDEGPKLADPAKEKADGYCMACAGKVHPIGPDNKLNNLFYCSAACANAGQVYFGKESK